MQGMLNKFIAHSSAFNPVVAAAAAPFPGPSATDQRPDKLTEQIDQFQTQNQQHTATIFGMVANEHFPGPPSSLQSRTWQGQNEHQIAQL